MPSFSQLSISTTYAQTSTTLTVYKFTTLFDNPSPEWEMSQVNPAEMRMDASTIQMFSAKEDEEADGEFIEIAFDAPYTGLYDIGMTAIRHDVAGGFVDILIDGEPIYEDYSFYAPNRTNAVSTTIGNAVALTEGTHTLRFNAKKGVLLTGTTKYYLYMYISEIRLQRIIPIELEEVELTIPGNKRVIPGQYVQLDLRARLNDGNYMNMAPEEVQIDFFDTEY